MEAKLLHHAFCSQNLIPSSFPPSTSKPPRQAKWNNRRRVRCQLDARIINGALSADSDPRYIDRQKALEAAMSDINSSFGKGSVTRLGSLGGALVETFPSGCLTLDFALGGGLPKGRIVEPDFWTDPMDAVRKAYRKTDKKILGQSNRELGKGGSTAVTAILINREKLVVGNVGDSRAVICTNGKARQLSVDHDAESGRAEVENKGGFVLSYPGKVSVSYFELLKSPKGTFTSMSTGDVPRVDGELAMTRAFGDRRLKMHLSSEPNVTMEIIGDDAEFVILASDGIWQVMSNQEAVDSIKHINDPKAAAKHLTDEALARESTDDISCIVIRFL